MGEEIHAQQRHQIGQAPVEASGHLQVAQQEHRNQGGPDLRLHGIGRGAHEGLNLQILFEGFEEQFNLPTIFVDGGNRAGSQGGMIGQEDQNVPCLLPNRFDTAYPMWALLLGPVAGQPDGLIFGMRRCCGGSRSSTTSNCALAFRRVTKKISAAVHSAKSR